MSVDNLVTKNNETSMITPEMKNGNQISNDNDEKPKRLNTIEQLKKKRQILRLQDQFKLISSEAKDSVHFSKKYATPKNDPYPFKTRAEKKSLVQDKKSLLYTDTKSSMLDPSLSLLRNNQWWAHTNGSFSISTIRLSGFPLETCETKIIELLSPFTSIYSIHIYSENTPLYALITIPKERCNLIKDTFHNRLVGNHTLFIEELYNSE
ncbi:hypothetical protein WA158_005349 [Blastocystis sp. Blastoise]